MSTKKQHEIDRDNAAAFDGPAVVANRSIVSYGPDGVRIAFLERNEGKPHFRTAVQLSWQQTEGLGDLLLKLCAEARKKMAASDKLASADLGGQLPT